MGSQTGALIQCVFKAQADEALPETCAPGGLAAALAAHRRHVLHPVVLIADGVWILSIPHWLTSAETNT